MAELDPRDREILKALQHEVPIASTPYAIIGQTVDVSEKEVLKRIERLKRDGVVKQIYGAFNGRAIGYDTSLVAARADAERIDEAAALISAHPGVSQNYRRSGDLNLWFTISVHSHGLGLERVVDLLRTESGCTATRIVRTSRTFSADEHESADEDESSDRRASPLSAEEIELVRLFQADLPVVPRPFEAVARRANCTEEQLLAAARRLRTQQLLRKFVAVVQPRRSGFTATAMSVWKAPDAAVDQVGRAIARSPGVTHCYVRETHDDWPFNLYATVEGRSLEECDALVAGIADTHGLHEYRSLYPLKEYKRRRVAFFAPEHDAWETARSSAGLAHGVAS